MIRLDSFNSFKQFFEIAQGLNRYLDLFHSFWQRHQRCRVQKVTLIHMIPILNFKSQKKEYFWDFQNYVRRILSRMTQLVTTNLLTANIKKGYKRNIAYYSKIAVPMSAIRLLSATFNFLMHYQNILDSSLPLTLRLCNNHFSKIPLVFSLSITIIVTMIIDL